MSENLHLVFSKPPGRIPDEEYNGFLVSWRFRLEPEVADASSPATSTHLAVYEVDGELPTLRANLDVAREKNEIHFPPWFGRIPFNSLDATALGERVPAPG